MTKKKFVEIPPEEWGPGSRVDFEKGTLIGVSGTIYTDLQMNVADIMRLWPPLDDDKKDNDT